MKERYEYLRILRNIFWFLLLLWIINNLIAGVSRTLNDPAYDNVPPGQFFAQVLYTSLDFFFYSRSVLDFWVSYVILFLILMFSIKYRRVLRDFITRFKAQGLSEKVKNQIKGILQAHGQINFSEACQVLSIPKDQLIILFKEFIKENALAGKFIGRNKFKVLTSMDQFVKAWDSQFENWAATTVKSKKV